MELDGKKYFQINSTVDLVVTVVSICNEVPSLSFGEGKRVRPFLGRQ